jgi:hypothetical protein
MGVRSLPIEPAVNRATPKPHQLSRADVVRPAALATQPLKMPLAHSRMRGGFCSGQPNVRHEQAKPAQLLLNAPIQLLVVGVTKRIHCNLP